MKHRSTFFGAETLASLRRNAAGSALAASVVEAADQWNGLSCDRLWQAVFGAELPRSHMVLSYGWCPACRQTVDKYGWESDPFAGTWKMVCPACREAFPKNDFGAYYRSGLDVRGLFHPELADRDLLYNAEAPDPGHPRHLFGVDDGTGYREGADRWMFVGTYLVHLWERFIYAGIVALARGFVLTGNLSYARRCGVLLDRVADVFPDFDFYEQGVMYEEERTSRGYISYWCLTTVQLRELALSYDAVFEALSGDEEFLELVVDRSARFQTPYRKTGFADFQRNVENRIFADALSQPWKIASNYPWPEVFATTVRMVLSNWPERPSDMAAGVYLCQQRIVEEDLDRILANVTRADGLSGEKGLAGYSPIALNETARLIALCSLWDPGCLGRALRKHPRLVEGFRLYANAWCLGAHYPGCGDTGSLSVPNRGIPFQPGYASLAAEPSMSALLYSFEGFVWQLYQRCGDANLVRLLVNSENFDPDRCFDTALALDQPPEQLRREVAALMAKEGSALRQDSANYQAWKLAILHSGAGPFRRCAVLDGDSGGVHGHNDGMSIGLYARGMSLLPDLGYPPAHRPGGWSSRFFYWYRSAAAHNTVIIDGREHRDFCYVQRDLDGGQGLVSESGRTVLWGIGTHVRAVAFDDPLIPGNAERFERQLVMVDVGEQDCYWFDAFRVRGGSQHVKLTRASVCTLQTEGLALVPFVADPDPYGMAFIRDRNAEQNFQYATGPDFAFVRNLRIDRAPAVDWHADWKYLNAYPGYFGDLGDRQLTLRYRDLTDRAEVIAYEAFYDSYGAVLTCFPERLQGVQGHPEHMLPGIAVAARGDAPLATTFLGLYEAREGGGVTAGARRLPVLGPRGGPSRAGDAAVEVELASGVGSRDLILSADIADGTVLVQPEWDVETDAALCHVRRDGSRHSVTAMQGTFVRCGGWRTAIEPHTGLLEAHF